jgi:signal transduction histidine kinase
VGAGRGATVRLRTTLAAVTVVAVALVLAGGLLVVLLERSLRAGVDASARLEAQAVVAAAGAGRLATSFPAAGNDTAFVQVVDPQGHVIDASTNVVDEAVLVRRPSRPNVQVVTVRGLPIGDQGAFRVAVQQSGVGPGALTVYAGVALGPAQRSVRTVAAGLAVGLPFVLLVVGAVAWWLTDRALAPVEAIRAEVADIAGHRDLGRRVPEPAAHDEVGSLARTMNDMLDRLEKAASNQRRFVADASHELRSPVASARAQIEVDLAHPQGARWETTAAGVLEDLARVEQLVDDLLALARADAPGGVRLVPKGVDLGQLVRECAARLEAANSGSAVPTLVLDEVQAATVLGDPESLRRVVDNLLGNAMRHAASRVGVSVAVDGDEIEMVVADDGPGVPAPERERIFERFARLDIARTRREGGAGLGLAITRASVEAHGGTVHVYDNAPGARFVVRLPAAPAGEDHGSVGSAVRHV